MMEFKISWGCKHMVRIIVQLVVSDYKVQCSNLFSHPLD
jgi:hypothetical protein